MSPSKYQLSLLLSFSIVVLHTPSPPPPGLLYAPEASPRELRDAGPAGRPPVGTGEHRPVRGRPGRVILWGDDTGDASAL